MRRLLMRLVEKYGERKWSHIAKMLPRRVGKQCRERWHNHLRPDIKKGGWSAEEDKVLIDAHRQLGNKWSEIAKLLPGRSENTIKNHWNATKRKQLASRESNSDQHKNPLQNYIKNLISTSDDVIVQETPSSGSISEVVDPKNSSNLSLLVTQGNNFYDPLVAAYYNGAEQSSDYVFVQENPSSGSILEVVDTNTSSNWSMLEMQENNSYDPLFPAYDNGAEKSFNGTTFAEGGGMWSMLKDTPHDTAKGNVETEVPSSLEAQIQFDAKKEMDFLELLFQGYI